MSLEMEPCVVQGGAAGRQTRPGLVVVSTVVVYCLHVTKPYVGVIRFYEGLA